MVAVIDTGVNADHPDLRGNILPGIDIVKGGFGNGQGDADGHGTGMAGLIAAHGHGVNAGTLGIAPRSKILPIRVETPADNGDTNDITAGIEWAINHSAQVICIPAGGGTSAEQLRTVNRAMQSNIVVVAGVGNMPRDTAVLSPARFQGVIASTAVDKNGIHWPQSVTGEQVILAAPGVEVVSTSLSDQYRIGTGTSDSTAIIAGAAALVRSKYPHLTADQVVHRLTATATDKGPPGRDEQYGYGVLNLVGALTADIPTAIPSPPPTPTSSGTSTGAAQRGAPGGSLLIGIVLAVAAVAGLGVLALMSRRRGREHR